MTNTQQGKLTDEERIEILCRLGISKEPVKLIYWSGPYEITKLTTLAASLFDAIEAEVEARTAKKMEALVEALRYAKLFMVGIQDPEVFAPFVPLELIEDAKQAEEKLRQALAAHQQDTVAEKGDSQ